MNSKKNYHIHFIALALLFVLGNACITAPSKTANEYNFLAFLVAGIAAIAVYGISCHITINRLTLLPIWLLSFYCIADAFITFAKFISDNLLPGSPRFLIVVPLAVILIYISFKNVNVLLKFSLISGILAVGVIILFFVSTLKDFDVKNVFIYRLPDASDFLEQLLPYVKSMVIPVVLLAVFGKIEQIKSLTAITGVAIGVVCFGLCILNAVLLFGIRFSAILDYPYYSAGSTVTFGYLFTRLDGFLYFLYLATVLVKSAVGIFVIKKSRELIP